MADTKWGSQVSLYTVHTIHDNVVTKLAVITLWYGNRDQVANLHLLSEKETE